MKKGPRVLLVRFSSLGDVVLATAAVEALREDRPEVELHVLTKPAFREVFEGNPGVARVLLWDPARSSAEVARDLGREDYDWVVDLHANLRTRLLRALLREPRWSVYRKGSLRRRLAVALHRPSLLPEHHVVDRYLAALAPLGVAPRRRPPRLHLDGGVRAGVNRLLAEAGWDGVRPLVALAPGARWATKTWPRERWAELAAGLRSEGLGFPVLLGGSEERSLCEAVLSVAGGAGVDLAGRTSVRETAAVLERAATLVTNDSAPLHLAASVGTPAVALFGPTVRGFGFAPLGPRDRVLERDLACRPCSLHGGERCPQGHHRCLADVGAGEVLTAIGAQIGNDEVGGGSPSGHGAAPWSA